MPRRAASGKALQAKSIVWRCPVTKKKPALNSADASENERIISSPVENGGAPPAEGDEQLGAVDNTALIEDAVAAGRLLIDQGKPKIAAAMVIYEKLEKLPQDDVVKVLIEGANLTSKGALTYWYNCRRKLKKARLNSAAIEKEK